MEKNIQQAMDQQTQEHQRITDLVIETVDYGQKITELKTEVALLKEFNCELKEEKKVAESWKMKLIGIAVGLVLTLGGPSIFMWSSIQQYDLRFERNEKTIEHHRQAFDELYDTVTVLQTKIAVLENELNNK